MEQLELRKGESAELAFFLHSSRTTEVRAISADSIDWQSDNLSVASVSNGIVAAEGKGNCTITARYKGHAPICKVVVEEPILAPSITLSTTKEVGKLLEISIYSERDFAIDWGNGEKKAYEKGRYDFETQSIEGKIRASNIAIYGEAILEFTVQGQKLSAIDLQNCQSLRELRLLSNDLSELDLSKNANLVVINCSRNKLKELNLSACKQLKELHCFKNELQVLQLSSSSNLELLYANKNKLKTLALEGETAIRYLNLSDNNFQSLTFASKMAPTELQISHNPLLDSLGAPCNFENLLCLFLNDNKLGREDLQTYVDALPDVSGVAVSEEDIGWKCQLKIKGNPASGEVDTSEAQKKGWKIGL